MASLLDSPVAFFAKATPEQFAFVLGQYREIFKVHAQETRGAKKNGPAELIKLDNWYQDTLPQLIKSRKDKQLLYDEIVQITKWKLLRGKFRPSILDLVKTNTETAIKNVTKKAFKKMPNINAAITALTQLKGIAPATASAILVAYSPDLCCYMSEENMASTPGVEESDLSISEYLNYVEQTNLCVERLKAQDPKTNWRSHDVELAMWTLYQVKQYNSNLLDNMPTGKKSDTNGNHEDNHEEVEENLEKNNLNEDEGVNSDRSEDENSNHSNNSNNSNNSNSSNNSQQSNQSIEQTESNEMNIDSQLNNNKTNGHSNGNNSNEESNLTSASSEYEEDKSNDSLLNNNSSNEEENIQNLENKQPEVAITEQMNIESSLQSEQQNEENQSNNQMEIVKTTDETTNVNHLTPIINNAEELIKKIDNETIVENLNNHHINNNELINNKLENKIEELKEKSNLINNLEINHHLSNGTIKNGINHVFNNEKLNNKETLISSSEDNSNNLSEENSNSNLSYSDHNNLDLHSTDNALDDQPALKRIRVE